MVPTVATALTDEQTLLLKAVQAEDIFSFGGSRDQDVHEIASLSSKLGPTSDGLPDPRVQQALLNHEGSQHSPSRLETSMRRLWGPQLRLTNRLLPPPLLPLRAPLGARLLLNQNLLPLLSAAVATPAL